MNNVHKREQAKRDLEETFVFIGERDLDTGLDFLFAAEQTFELLANMPLIGSQRRSRSSKLRDVRQFPVKGYKDYLIFYLPTDNGIEVLRVLHGRRDIEAIFEEQS
ncbi:MAG: type II toxin-antitoxin system RelE/ParE family toxin [Blastocatellales bacterium]